MLTEQQIRNIIAECNTKLDWNAQDKHARFDTMGLDSLDRFDIIIGLQEASDVEVPDDDVEKLYSIAAIEAYYADR